MKRNSTDASDSVEFFYLITFQAIKQNKQVAWHHYPISLLVANKFNIRKPSIN